MRLNTLARTAHLVALGFALGACDGTPMGPEPFAPEPCHVPAELMAEVTPQPFAPGALRSAVLHAAGPMSAALGSTTLAGELVKAAAQLGEGMRDGAGDTECRVLDLASSALARLPEDPATLPDRSGIRLVLALAAKALAQHMGQ